MSSINSINNINNVNDLNKIGSAAAAVKTAVKEENVVKNNSRQDQNLIKKDNKDKENNGTGIYSREALLDELRASEEQRVQAFQDTIRSMLAQQGENVNITFRGMDLHVTEEKRIEAEKSISDGGEYSVENVADRIMKMAKALGGDDESKIDMLQNAVIKGFESAAGLLGKESLDDMPEITRKTYDNVMNQFNEWKDSFKTAEKEMTNLSANQVAAQAVQAEAAKV